jgi:hypothetical protein
MVERFGTPATFRAMSNDTEEIIRLCEALPKEKRAEVADFARFLLARSGSADDAAWEQQVNDARPLPKLEDFLQKSAAEKGDEPLDLKRL